MCGIVGANFHCSSGISNSLELLKQRGPEYQNLYCQEQFSLGHARLSIVDLDNEANQPMVFDGVVIVFNGEIYNYKQLILSENLFCETKSDTEVLIRLYQKYGTDFLSFLNGAFAFCIYDTHKNLFFCARDRYGKKPFYYYFEQNKFIFSSKIQPIINLLGYTPKLNKVALSQYLQYFVPLAPNTFYTSINKLENGSFIVYEKNSFQIKKYYKVKTYKTIKDEQTAIEKIEEILFDSIHKRIDCDVEVGSLLSGGIDSSLIATIYAKNTQKKIKTFSIGYDTHTKYSELPYANLVAKQIKSDHLALELSKKDFIESLEEVFEDLEEPHADPASIPLWHLTKQINQQGIKTVLSGEGSDELFLGYDNYFKFLKYYRFEKTLTQEQYSFLDDIIGALQTNTKESEYLRRVIKKENIYNSFGEIYTQSQRKKLLQKVANFKIEVAKKDPIDWMSYIDLKIWLGEALLSKVDKMCMAHSVENRNPFLDYRLVDTVYAISSDLKVGDTNKYLLKKIASKYIPDTIINRPKKGFNSPFNEWLFETYSKKLLEDIKVVNDQTQLFNNTYVEYIYSQASQNHFKQHFYALWHFCKWYKKIYL